MARSSLVSDIKQELFRLRPIRVMVASFFFMRGALRLLFDPFAGISDFCWVYRVSGVKRLMHLSYGIVSRYLILDNSGQSKLVRTFLRSKYPNLCVRQFLGPSSELESAFRDIIVLKAPVSDEKGVLLLKYTAKFDLFISLFDLDRIMSDYYIVLEPCWAGYCDPSILMFLSARREVIVQCPEESDYDFISKLRSNLIPIRLGASDWINPEIFSVISPEKKYDLIMVGNWAKGKNHGKLFQALPHVKHKPLSLLLIGYDWEGRTDRDILREMKLYDLNGVTVTIKNKLPAREVAANLGMAKVFILLSEKEGSNKAIVEALFSDVPVIVYDQFVGGARNKVNRLTGVLSSYQGLADKIDYMLNNHQHFTPRAWALENTGSVNATKSLNDTIRQIAWKRGEKWDNNIVEKINTPNLAYRVRDAMPAELQVKAIATHYLRK